MLAVFLQSDWLAVDLFHGFGCASTLRAFHVGFSCAGLSYDNVYDLFSTGADGRGMSLRVRMCWRLIYSIDGLRWIYFAVLDAHRR